MATIRRAGFGTVFELEDSKVGIGTDAATHTLQALGNIRSEAATDIGISSLTTYQGFVDKEARFTKGQIDNQSQSGSTSGEIVIDGDVTVSSATTFTSGPQHLTVTDTFTLPSGDTNSREEKPTPGSLRFNQDFATLEFYTGNNWATVNTFTDIQNSPGSRGRGVIMGGNDGSSNLSDIDFIDITTQGNAVSFGTLTETAGYINGNNVSSSTRGLRQGGYTPSRVNTVDYLTMASTGDAINFGDLTTAAEGGSGCSSSTRAIRAGGHSGSHVNVIDYAEISTLGNYLDFGDLPETVYNGPDGVSNGTRGLFAGGLRSGGGSGTSRIDMITISSKGNSVKFGDLIDERRNIIPCANQTRGIFMGGRHGELAGEGSFIEYITMASEGNAVFFGDLSTDRFRGAGTNNHIRGVAIGGDTNQPNGSNINVIEFITIATTGNAQDFGDAQHKYEAAVGCSDSHGGLGGF